MLHEGRCSILCLMSVIEGRLPAQRCVLVLEHPASVRHTALCRDAARFALFVGSSPACPLELHTRPVVMAPPMQRPLSASAFSSIVPPGVQYV